MEKFIFEIRPSYILNHYCCLSSSSYGCTSIISLIIHIPLYLLLIRPIFIHLFSSHSSPSGTHTCLASLHHQYFLPPFMLFYLIHPSISVLLFTHTEPLTTNPPILHHPNVDRIGEWLFIFDLKSFVNIILPSL